MRQRIEKPRAVEMHMQAMPTGHCADRRDLGNGIDGADLGRLSQADDFRFGIMNVLPPEHHPLDRFWGQPAMGPGNCQQLGAI